MFRWRRKVKPVTPDSKPEDILDSWANMMTEHLRLSSDDVDANGVSEHQSTRQKIRALRAGARAIRALRAGARARAIRASYSK